MGKEERLNEVLRHVADAVILADHRGRVVSMNPVAERLMRWKEADACGMDAAEVVRMIDKETRQPVGPHLFGNLDEKGAIDLGGHTLLVDGNGVEIQIEGVIAPIRNGKGKLGGAVLVFRDITGRKELEKEKEEIEHQLRQSQKMEAVGRLAGGIAHDFNNLLTIIHGYTSLSLNLLTGGDLVSRNLDQIRSAAELASGLTHQLLAFSRRQVMEMKVIDLRGLAEDLDRMLRRIIGEDIDLVLSSTGDLGNVKADPHQIEQAVLNLAVNARDAMPSGGKLSINMANVELSREEIRAYVGMRPGRYVLISVSDTGVGMPPEVQEHLFEPFFTTKQKGKGTGLGLSTVYGIVKQSDGFIRVDTEPGRGTTFRIYLPRVDEGLEVVRERKSEGDILGGSETILVIEDDKGVATLVIEFLKTLGYDVFAASRFDEAMRFCEDNKKPIHLILCDVVMPQMSGPRLIEHLRRIREDFRVIFMSGYTDDAIGNHGVLRDGVEFIRKPFSFRGLSRKVREALDRPDPAIPHPSIPL